MFTLFLFGSLWFWGLLAIASIILISCLEKDNEVGATVVFLGTLVAVLFLGNSNWFPWIYENPLQIGLLAGAYLFIGVGWGIAKWWVYLHDISARNRAARCEWVVMKKARLDSDDEDYPSYEAACNLVPPRWPDKVKKDWNRYVKMEYEGKPIKKPMVSDNKSRITGWMTYWPWSALWTLINDPVRRFFRWVFNQIRGLLQGMSDKAFKGLDE